jgi:hypothetical protein
LTAGLATRRLEAVIQIDDARQLTFTGDCPGQERVLGYGRFGAGQLMIRALAALAGVIEIELGYSPNCGGKLKIISVILELLVIGKILAHLGLQARAPQRAPARGQARCRWPWSSFAFRRRRPLKAAEPPADRG